MAVDVELSVGEGGAAIAIEVALGTAALSPSGRLSSVCVAGLGATAAKLCAETLISRSGTVPSCQKSLVTPVVISS